MGLEIELKYTATPELQARMREAFAGQEHTVTMETVYYDTPSGALSRRCYTLRRRRENGVSVCTVKTPAQSGRGEWNVTCEALEDAVPLLIAAGAPACLRDLTAQGTVPVCGAAFTRIFKEITYMNSRIELAFDTGVLTGGGREFPLCEIEAELKSGTEAELNALGRELVSRFGLVPEPRSKFKRALCLAKGEPL